MKQISILIIILFSTVSLFAKTKIIFDADIDTDCDDAGALAVLHALADNGEAEILATIVSSRYPYCAPCVEAINRYYNRPNIPIGAPKTTWSDSGGRGSAYADHIATEYVTTLNSNDDAPDAVAVYRQILAGQEDSSVVILTVGYLTNIRDLLQSGPDEFSPLNGVDLVIQKVSRWVQTGAAYPSSYNTAVCGNYTPDPTSARIAFQDWPEASVPMYISGEGNDILTGASLPSTPTNNPVRRAYELRVGLGNTRDSWDQIGTLFAVRPDDARWTFRTNGYYYIFENGTYEWRTTPDKNHTVLEYNTSLNAGLRLTLDQLMIQAPAAPTEPIEPYTDNQYNRGLLHCDVTVTNQWPDGSANCFITPDDNSSGRLAASPILNTSNSYWDIAADNSTIPTLMTNSPYSGNYLSFDGGDSIIATNGWPGGDNMTIDLAFRFNGLPSHSGDNYMGLFMTYPVKTYLQNSGDDTHGKILMIVYETPIVGHFLSSTKTLNPNVWYHLSFSLSNNNAQIVVGNEGDGYTTDTMTVPGVIETTMNDVVIGNSFWVTSRLFQGDMDEIRWGVVIPEPATLFTGILLGLAFLRRF